MKSFFVCVCVCKRRREKQGHTIITRKSINNPKLDGDAREWVGYEGIHFIQYPIHEVNVGALTNMYPIQVYVVDPDISIHPFQPSLCCIVNWTITFDFIYSMFNSLDHVDIG